MLNLLLLCTAVGVAYYVFPKFFGGFLAAALLCFASTLGSAFVLFFPQKLAVISDFGIKIDRNSVLDWKDVKAAHEKLSSRLGGRRIIVFELKDGVCYPLAPMQKLCQRTKFTAFSIPLYAMTRRDQEEIKKIVATYTQFMELQNA